MLLAIARHHLKLPTDELEAIRQVRKRVYPERVGRVCPVPVRDHVPVEIETSKVFRAHRAGQQDHQGSRVRWPPSR